MNYISVIERYHEYKTSIHELMASIIVGTHDEALFNDEMLITKSMTWLSKHYPFVELMFTLDNEGVQISRNIASSQYKISDPLEDFGFSWN